MANLRAVPARPATVENKWDARFELWLGASIHRYLADNPAPSDAITAADGALWADNLIRSGRGRREALGLRTMVGVL